MGRKGLYIDYEFCTGCHTCEIACQVEKNLPLDQWGIKVAEIGPWQIEGDKWQYTYIPTPTDQCNLCAERTVKGKQPMCVKHCSAAVMKYGDIDDLYSEMQKKNKVVLYTVV